MKEYLLHGTVCDIKLPDGLVGISQNLNLESAQLPQPLFTPSTKALVGGHDENIHPGKLVGLFGESRAMELERLSLDIYHKVGCYFLQLGISQ